MGFLYSSSVQHAAQCLCRPAFLVTPLRLLLCGVVFPGEWRQSGISSPLPGHRSAEAACPPQAHCDAGERFQIKGSTAWSSPCHLNHSTQHLPIPSQSLWQRYLQSQPRHSPPGDAYEKPAYRATWHQTHPQVRWERGFHLGPAARWFGSQWRKTEEQWQSAGDQWTWPEAWNTWKCCSDHTGTSKDQVGQQTLWILYVDGRFKLMVFK